MHNGGVKLLKQKKIKDKINKMSLDVLESWALKKGVQIDFDYCTRDEYRPSDKLITISTRQGLENQLHALLHECGHLLLANNELSYAKKYPSSAKLWYKDNKKLVKSHKYKVDVISEEIDAWRKGKELADRLDLYIDEGRYYSIMTKCVWSYIRDIKHVAS
jgi:hypothetical protein